MYPAIDPTHDYANCGGPRRCSYCRAILTESPHRQYNRIIAEDSVRLRSIRSAHRAACGDKPNFTPPDPYAADIAKRRAQLPSTPSWPKTPADTSTTTAGYAPPDPYAADLKKRKEQR